MHKNKHANIKDLKHVGMITMKHLKASREELT